MAIHPSLVHTNVLAALHTTEYDTEVRHLAAMVNPTRGDLVRMLGERFHTLERSRGKSTKTHGDHALYASGPAVKNGGRRGQAKGGAKSGEGQLNSKDTNPDNNNPTPWKGWSMM